MMPKTIMSAVEIPLAFVQAKKIFERAPF